MEEDKDKAKTKEDRAEKALGEELTPSFRKKEPTKSGASSAGPTIPILIVLVGALLIFGVTKMLSSDKDHRDLVGEMKSKRFGNRWIAAFELSKLVLGEGIDPSEIPWLVENLIDVYDTTMDHRTRNFIVITLGHLKHPLGLPLLEKALDDPDPTVVFSAVVAVGNLPEGMGIHWPKLMALTTSSDEGIRHGACLALSAKRAPGARPFIEARLKDEAVSVRYGAALALIPYRSEKARSIIRDILERETHDRFDAVKFQQVRLGVISAIGRNRWIAFSGDLQKLAKRTRDLRIETAAKEALNLLKM
ncbi:MAG: HEAT repeat domain-containing protein [Bacteriovoracales bacterium]|nr:HEAT repeat domain-containing protein [Bacteriovoracales bacterium]